MTSIGDLPDHFGPHIATRYDADEASMFTPDAVDPAVDLLADLARNGRACEFAVGTGRIALPLRARGVDVAGIDLSTAMVEQLRAKPGGAEVDVTIGDFCTTRVPGTFTLVYLVFNTIGNVTTQEQQTDVFVNAARHLSPGGSFVIEVGVPRLQELPRGQTLVPFESRPDKIGFDEYDTVTQSLISHHWTVREDGRLTREALPLRYVWPSELDLMARIAGLHLVARWAGWDRAPFTADSTRHVSVWQR